MIGSPADLYVEAVRAGGDVLLKVNGSILDTYVNGFAAIGAFGDLSMSANGAIRGGPGHTTDPLRIALPTPSQLFADASGNIDLLQVNGNMTIDGVTKAVSDLYVVKVSSGAQTDIEVTLGNMTVERVDAATGSHLKAQGSILDAFDDAGGPIVNVATGDLDLQAGQNVGSATNFFDVQVAGA